MSLRGVIKKLPFARAVYRRLVKPDPQLDDYDDLENRPTEALLSIMRHESHRIEKAVYNNLIQTKEANYTHKKARLEKIYEILRERGHPDKDPTVEWSRKIFAEFGDLENNFIKPNSRPPKPFQQNQASPFVEFLRERRSVRVWDSDQPSEEDLRELALKMIDAARWAPTSGNRQPWRFRIITKEEEKNLLQGIKEHHCIRSPLLIFVGMDTRFYGALGLNESSQFIDAGAAIMQMVLTAHKCGLGVCWNHFAEDLITSRRSNITAYSNFARVLKIPKHVAPIAILSIGRPKFIPPEPARAEIASLLIS